MKNWESQLKNEARELRVDFSEELHEKIMARVASARHSPQPARGVWVRRLLMPVACATACLLLVFGSSVEEESLPATVQKDLWQTPSETALRVAHLSGIPLEKLAASRDYMPSRETLASAFEESSAFFKAQFEWMIEDERTNKNE
ncbi:MAG: hypothetical protein Q4D38_11020 [Planctomycetia bacterium]|nr:hypothetical protein [Planctomycetia bacterium]